MVIPVNVLAGIRVLSLGIGSSQPNPPAAEDRDRLYGCCPQQRQEQLAAVEPDLLPFELGSPRPCDPAIEAAAACPRREAQMEGVEEPSNSDPLRRPKLQPSDGGARWATKRDLKPLHVKGTTKGRITLGYHGRQLIAPLLFAARSKGGSMKEVIDWLNRGQGAEGEVGELLKKANSEPALGAWEANKQRDPKLRSSIYTTAEQVLGPFGGTRSGVA